MTVGKQIGWLVAGLLGLLAVSTSLSWWNFRQVGELAHLALGVHETNEFFLQREVDHLQWTYALDQSLLLGKTFDKELDPTRCGLGKWLYDNEVRRTADPTLLRLMGDLEAPHRALHAAGEAIKAALSSGSVDEAKELYVSKFQGALGAVGQSMGDFKTYFRDQAEKKGGAAVRDLGNAIDTSNIILLIIGVSGIVGAGVISVFMVRGISRRLRGIIASVSEASQDVVMASSEINEAATKISSSTVQTAASLEETASSFESFARNIDSVNQRMDEVSKSTHRVLGGAKGGNGQVLALKEAVTGIAATSQKVRNITDIIDGIAFQTNLLALNAAVEAARSGEHGKGFAVVAEAVRSLAQKSAASAKEISQLVDMNAEQSKKGVDLAAGAVSVLEEIVRETESVSKLVVDVSDSMREQSQTTKQLVSALDQIDNATQANAAASEEAAAISGRLAQLSGNLREASEELSSAVG